MWRISIHKALAGLDNRITRVCIKINDFNPQGPRGPRHSPVIQQLLNSLYFNPQGPRGPRLSSTTPFMVMGLISIHKALAGLDVTDPEVIEKARKFQSTRPSRASTGSMAPTLPEQHNFNPQGPRGPRPYGAAGRPGSADISIHKALAGLDGVFHRVSRKHYICQSTRPSRASTFS